MDAQVVLSLLLRKGLFDPEPGLLVGGGCQSSGSKVEAADCAQDQSGGARLENLQLPENRSREGKD